MLWYGLNSLNSLSNQSIHNFKRKINLKTKILNFSSPLRLNFSKYKFFLYLPNNWSFVLLNAQSFGQNNLARVCYIYSSSYYFQIALPTHFSKIYYDKLTNVILLFFSLKNNYYRVYWKFFSSTFNSFNKLFFKKIKFKGKGYYVFKNIRNTIALQFGYSHRRRLYSYYISVKFLSKTSIFLFGINKYDLSNIGYSFFNVKPINIFTGKGIRFSRQIVYKKAGKVSSYR